MADFTSSFWSWFIIITTLGGILGCYLLIQWLSRGKKPEGKQIKTMGHVWDGDLAELNNPLPRWWLNMFYITMVFGVIYLVLYPGLGSYAGILGWGQTTQYEKEVRRAEDRYGPYFKAYAGMGFEELIANEKGLAVGRRLFLNYCATCHGSDAGGARGFPNLTDNDWLYGGAPENIKASIMNGRKGIMPSFGAALADDGVEQVAAYVLSLSGRDSDPVLAEAGKPKFQAMCSGCHMPDAGGNQAIGAPRLSDNIWLYGASPGSIKQTIREGRNGVMPAHKEFLGEDKVHIVAAYVYSLSASKD